jgi:NADP-dependent 3-hydroxy acid dehydrogenase YdfG
VGFHHINPEERALAVNQTERAMASQSNSQTIVGVFKDVYPNIDPSTYGPGAFKGKVVYVSGAGSGIGKETALAFSQMGASVAFADWREDAAKKAVEEAKKFGNKAIAMGGDVTKLADTVAMYEKTVKELGEIDICVFSAGYGMFDRFDISREKDWWGLIETNLKGPTDFTRLVLPSMKKRNTGKLIYISSRVPKIIQTISFSFL